MIFSERGGKVLQGDGSWGSCCFLRHIWLSSVVLAQENTVYQGLFDSDGLCLRRFARKQGVNRINREKWANVQGVSKRP
jgi:hypothetical protein